MSFEVVCLIDFYVNWDVAFGGRGIGTCRRIVARPAAPGVIIPVLRGKLHYTILAFLSSLSAFKANLLVNFFINIISF